MAGEEGRVKIEKFDGVDFGFWRMQIEDYLYGKDLYLPLIGKKQEAMSDVEWEILDRKAPGVIRLSLTCKVAFNIAKEKSTASLMKTLTDMYEKPVAANKVHLMRRLFTLTMQEDTSVTEYLNEFIMVTTQLSSVEIDFDDEIRALILLSSLPESWNGMVTVVSSSVGKNKMVFNDVRDLIISEDIRRRETGQTSGSILNTERRGRTSSRKSDREKSKSKFRSKSRPGKQENSDPSTNLELWKVRTLKK